jgi:phosphoribosyl 1,2-cyclic phosphodiesterase
MRLTFVGTRGYIEERSRLHRRHSALLVETRFGRALFDCGEDWMGRIEAIAPDVIFITHAHPDHAAGLRAGASCPVYATAETWALLAGFPVREKRVLTDRTVRRAGLSVRAFGLIHSLRAPAVGFRVAADGAVFFYAPDIVDILDRKRALSGVDLYVGDGASPTRPLVRRHGGSLFGHTTIRAQLGWCAEARIAQAIFTHCGAQIVRADGRRIGAHIRRLGRAQGVNARLAHDGLQITLP